VAANSTTATDATGQPAIKYFYKIRAVNNGSVSDFSSEVSTIITGIEDEHTTDIEIFPNPVGETLRIKNPGTETMKINIVNPLGQVMAYAEVGAGSEIRVPCSTWSSGIYVLKTLSERSRVVRILKE
jgi:hypothetical protein